MNKNNKYQRWYVQLIERARNRLIEGYKECHHIVPKSLGGTDDESNLVDLTAREHLIAHMLLPRFVENNKPMWQALWCMVHMGEVKLTGRRFEYVKEQYIISQRNKKLSPEHIAKMVASKSGKKQSLVWYTKMKTYWDGKRGTKRSTETINKIIATKRGSKYSDEHRASISAGQKKRHAANKAFANKIDLT